MRTIGGVTGALLLSIVVALLSMRVQRTGPEQVAYGNLCGPTGDDLCYRPVLKGGFPLAYLYDAPGVSVENRLAFGEDHFRAGAFAVDVAVMFALIAAGHHAWRRRANAR